MVLSISVDVLLGAHTCHFSPLEFASKRSIISNVLLVKKEINPVTRTKAETNWVYKPSTLWGCCDPGYLDDTERRTDGMQSESPPGVFQVPKGKAASQTPGRRNSTLPASRSHISTRCRLSGKVSANDKLKFYEFPKPSLLT